MSAMDKAVVEDREVLRGMEPGIFADFGFLRGIARVFSRFTQAGAHFRGY